MGLARRFLRLIGVELGTSPAHLLVVNKRFPFVVLAVGLVGLVGTGWFIHYTSTPDFCYTCHYIRPYVESWRASSHNKVTCAYCHFAPGIKGLIQAKMGGITELIKTIMHTEGPRPRAEVEDASCLREGCHETRLLDGQVEFKGKYHFNHTTHLTGLRLGGKLRCTSCHSQIVQGAHFSVTEGVCFTCHFKGEVHERYLSPIAGCTACHDMPTEQIRINDYLTFEHKAVVARGVQCWKCHFDSTEGTGEVPRQVCLDCHNEPEKLAKYDDSAAIHEQHVTAHKVECLQCHSEIRHGLHPQPGSRQDSCATCHTDHTLQEDLFNGVGPDGQAVTPSVHSQAQVDCVACHEFSTPQHGKAGVGMATYEVTEEACMQCHGPAIKGLLGKWKAGLSDLAQEAEDAITKARATVEALPEGAAPRQAAEAALQQARRSLDYVERGHGVHNPEYSFDLLDQVIVTVRKAAQAAGAGQQQAAPP